MAVWGADDLACPAKHSWQGAAWARLPVRTRVSLCHVCLRSATLASLTLERVWLVGLPLLWLPGGCLCRDLIHVLGVPHRQARVVARLQVKGRFLPAIALEEALEQVHAACTGTIEWLGCLGVSRLHCSTGVRGVRTLTRPRRPRYAHLVHRCTMYALPTLQQSCRTSRW